jgi:hypothetical protein
MFKLRSSLRMELSWPNAQIKIIQLTSARSFAVLGEQGTGVQAESGVE